jgi:hypothetical protein
LRCPRFGRIPVTPVPDSGFQPGCELPTDRRRGVELASHGFVVDAIEACGDVRIQHPCRFLVELDIDRADRIPGATSRATALALGFELRFPFRFERLFDQALLGPIRDGWNAQWALLQCAGFRNVDPTHRCGVPVELQVLCQG